MDIWLFFSDPNFILNFFGTKRDSLFQWEEAQSNRLPQNMEVLQL